MFKFWAKKMFFFFSLFSIKCRQNKYDTRNLRKDDDSSKALSVNVDQNNKIIYWFRITSLNFWIMAVRVKLTFIESQTFIIL